MLKEFLLGRVRQAKRVNSFQFHFQGQREVDIKTGPFVMFDTHWPGEIPSLEPSINEALIA